MKILVTGAAGFIGAFLTRTLRESGHQVLGIDSFNDYYDPELKEMRISALLENDAAQTIIRVDIKDLTELEKVFSENNFDVVVHLAAQAGVRLDPSKYIDGNVVGFLNVLKCVEANGVSSFLFASSSSVYGNFVPTPYLESENNLRPASFYGLTKKLNEDYCQLLSQRSSLKMRALRFFTVYGPWGRPDMAYFRLISAALQGHEFRLFGDGNIQRDFTFVEDVVSIIEDLVIELVSRPNTSFYDKVNIGGARPLSIRYLISEIEKQTGERIQITEESANSADSQITEASKVYLSSLLGELEYIRLEDGISKTLEWAASSEIVGKLNSWVKSTR